MSWKNIKPSSITKSFTFRKSFNDCSCEWSASIKTVSYLIFLSNWLKNSFEVLNRLKKRTEINNFEIVIWAFTNCREVWFTFLIHHYDEIKKEFKIKTFCVYEHRNSDSIIINWKDWYITHNWDLPYATDSKWWYLWSAWFEEYDKATDILVNEILKLNN